MLTPDEAAELAKLMRQRESYRAKDRDDRPAALARCRDMLVAAFGEADFAAATGETEK